MALQAGNMLFKQENIKLGPSRDQGNTVNVHITNQPRNENLVVVAAGKNRISAQARRHNEMRRKIIARSTEARTLAGPNPWTVMAVPVLLGIHWGVAWLVSGSNVLVCFLAAFFVGQIVIHATGALVHETAHRLIFKSDRSKLLFDLSLEVILGSFSKQLTYQHQHISSHHPFIGNYDRDYEHEDICSFNARRSLLANSPVTQRLMTLLTLVLHVLPFGFLVSDEVMPRLYKRLTGQVVNDKARHIGSGAPTVLDRRLFIAVSLLTNVALFWLFGFWGWLYHNWSLSLFLGKFGVTNLGQSLSEHEGDDDRNPTYSDYRATNWLFFNTGYHNEHHTFPNIPWTRLPKLRQLAPDVFNRQNPRSYIGLWWRHLRSDFGPSRNNDMMSADLSRRCPKVLER
jgi:sphingolipid delta-4 desaturase